MTEEERARLEAGPEQMRYASILEKGMYVGLLFLFLTYTIYALGIMRPYIPLEKISDYWSMNVHDYLESAHIETGWSWVGMLKYGDFINFIGIVILAGATIVCYLSIIPILLRKNDRVYAVLAFLEVLIIGLAASGLLTVGH